MFGFRVAVCGVWRDHFVIDMYDGSVLTRLHRHTVLFFFVFGLMLIVLVVYT